MGDGWDHIRRVRRELEHYRPRSARWRAARDLAIAAIDSPDACPNPDNADRTTPADPC